MTCRMSLRRPRAVPQAENSAATRSSDSQLGHTDVVNEGGERNALVLAQSSVQQNSNEPCHLPKSLRMRGNP